MRFDDYPASHRRERAGSGNPRGSAGAASPLERKFLDEGRGGYCFEQNSLFDAVLAEVGFGAAGLLDPMLLEEGPTSEDASGAEIANHYSGGVLAEDPFAREELRSIAQREFAVDGQRPSPPERGRGWPKAG